MGRGVAELRQSCEMHTLGETSGLILDLTDVSFADADGVKLLQDLKIRNVALLNLAPFLDLQLRDPLTGKRSTRNKNDEPEGSP